MTKVEEQIIGAQPLRREARFEWGGMSFTVKPGVYLPAEDSFMLAEAVSKHARGRFLEIGCGCGLTTIAAAKAGCEATGVDVNPKAVENARLNAEANGVSCEFYVSNLFSRVKGRFDTIAMNPPYLPASGEDIAWAGGRTGRKLTDRFLKQFDRFLTPKGHVILLHSDLSDSGQTAIALEKLGFKVRKVAQKEFFFERLYVLLGER